MSNVEAVENPFSSGNDRKNGAGFSAPFAFHWMNFPERHPTIR
jgi:hypothetical protein